ncbi:low affinity Fe/Cu permease [Rhizobium sp. BK379]|nr:low affinity Fe/Cu permease [Rhizobium sp. BK379]
MTVRHAFARFATKISEWAGKPVTFILALIAVIIWAALGPVFGYSETWQLVINTGTTIITFLMVFVLQNAQTRDTRAIQRSSTKSSSRATPRTASSASKISTRRT